MRLVCSLAVQLLQGKSKNNTKRLKTKWSMYEFRGYLQAARIREHATSEQHRRALKLLQNTGSVAGSREPFPEESDSEAELFAKAVPQLEDWLAAWRACESDQSWVSAAKSVRLFQYGSFARGATNQIRKQLKTMAEIMREVIRQKKKDMASRGRGNHFRPG